MKVYESIREHLKHQLNAKTNSTRFDSHEELDLAIRTIRKRFDKLVSMCTRMSTSDDPSGKSFENLLSWLEQEKSRSRAFDFFSPNGIPMSSFVQLSASSNGLCLLPPREDCLTGMEYVHPDFESESDLLNLPAILETVPSVTPTIVTEPIEQLVSLKRLKVKHR
jgi:hypothetical protein